MGHWKDSKYYYPFLIIGSLVIAIIVYSGVVMKGDMTGRILIGSVWLLVSIGWIGRYLHTKRSKNPTGN